VRHACHSVIIWCVKYDHASISMCCANVRIEELKNNPMTEPIHPAEDTPGDLLKDAQAWLRRMTSGDMTQFEAQAFQRWCQKSPAHRAAFAEAKAQWQLLKPAIGTLLRTNPEAEQVHWKTLHKHRMGRRLFLGAAGSVAAGVAVAAYAPLGLWPSVGQWGADFRTAAGQQKNLVFDGHADVELNTRTSIKQIKQHDQLAGLDLLDGEACVRTHAGEQAFQVVAGNGRSMSRDGYFEVRNVEGRVCVTCIQGQVQVEHALGVRTLQMAQQVVYDNQFLGQVAGVDSESVAAWRHGYLVFQRAGLADVIAEINRYRQGHIILARDITETMSARIRVTELDAAVLQIQRTYNLQARALPADIMILS
jgi:transmembrane sensor